MRLKASELVANLQELITQHGDQFVTIPTDAEQVFEEEKHYGDEACVDGVSCFEDDNGKVTRFMICDHETMMSFI